MREKLTKAIFLIFSINLCGGVMSNKYLLPTLLVASVIIAIVISDEELLKQHIFKQTDEATIIGQETITPMIPEIVKQQIQSQKIALQTKETNTDTKEVASISTKATGAKLLPPERRYLAKSNYRKLSGIYFSRKQKLKERIKGFRNLTEEQRQKILKNRQKNMIMQYNSEQEAHNTDYPI